MEVVGVVIDVPKARGVWMRHLGVTVGKLG